MDLNELFTIPLFDSIPPEKREVFLSGLDYTVSFLEKGELVARSGDLCKHLYLLMKGKVKTEMVDGSGAVLRIETIYAHRPLAPAFLFAENNRFPVTVTVLEDAEIVLISRDSVLTALLQYESFLKKFLLLNAECMKCLTDKLHLLACKTIRSRLIFYLLDQAKKRYFIFCYERDSTGVGRLFRGYPSGSCQSALRTDGRGVDPTRKETDFYYR